MIATEKENIVALENEINSLEKIKNTFSKDYDSKNNLINVQNQKIFLYSENVGNIENEIEILKNRENELLQRIDGHKLEIENLNLALQEKKLEFDKLNEEALAFKIKMESSINASEEKRNSLFEMHKSINKLQSDRSSIESIMANFQERINQFDKEIQLETKEKETKIEELEIINVFNQVTTIDKDTKTSIEIKIKK